MYPPLFTLILLAVHGVTVMSLPNPDSSAINTQLVSRQTNKNKGGSRGNSNNKKCNAIKRDLELVTRAPVATGVATLCGVPVPRPAATVCKSKKYPPSSIRITTSEPRRRMRRILRRPPTIRSAFGQSEQTTQRLVKKQKAAATSATVCDTAVDAVILDKILFDNLVCPTSTCSPKLWVLFRTKPRRSGSNLSLP
ncbi:hypothetical protein CPB85DRAFT_607166 [Mucidula mucida]|nr:hypothetical protein CPB85DRAFT_607166 [Mucidula mucida]